MVYPLNTLNPQKLRPPLVLPPSVPSPSTKLELHRCPSQPRAPSVLNHLGALENSRRFRMLVGPLYDPLDTTRNLLTVVCFSQFSAPPAASRLLPSSHPPVPNPEQTALATYPRGCTKQRSPKGAAAPPPAFWIAGEQAELFVYQLPEVRVPGI